MWRPAPSVSPAPGGGMGTLCCEFLGPGALAMPAGQFQMPVAPSVAYANLAAPPCAAPAPCRPLESPATCQVCLDSQVRGPSLTMLIRDFEMPGAFRTAF